MRDRESSRQDDGGRGEAFSAGDQVGYQSEVEILASEIGHGIGLGTSTGYDIPIINRCGLSTSSSIRRRDDDRRRIREVKLASAARAWKICSWSPRTARRSWITSAEEILVAPR